MLASTLFTATSLLATLSTALPATVARTVSYSNGEDCGLRNFYLVTTSSPHKAASAKQLPNVSAVSVFDPFYQSTYILRTIAAGYNSLPTFNISAGQLHTLTEGPHNVGEFVYNSTAPAANTTLGFVAEPARTGQWKLELVDGYLLNVAGSKHVGHGWTLCEGPLEEQVIYWKGTGETCQPTFIQAYSAPPY